MQALASDMAQAQQNFLATNNNLQPSIGSTLGQPVTDDYAQLWVNQLEQWTNIFYNNPNAQNLALWQDAQTKLVQFQRIHNPFELCTKIIEKSQNSLVLYQATLCLKNAVASDHKKFDTEELFKLFQFLYEFMCSKSLEIEMSVNETAALICAMILKRIASERSRPIVADSHMAHCHPATDEEVDRITQVITTLCNHVKDPNETLNKKIACALMLSSLLLECQMTNRSTLLGIRVWKHLNARKLIESHLKIIVEACLSTINWAFSSNLLNPVNQTRETQILFNLVGSLIHCVEYALAFNSNDTGLTLAGDRVLRVLQNRTINMLSQPIANDQRHKQIMEFCNLIMSPSVVQFLFTLYSTIKSMVNVAPGWSWPTNILKNCLNCLYYLADFYNSTMITDKGENFSEFVGNLMLGSVKILDAEVQGIDDSFQITCFITSIATHTSEYRDLQSEIKPEHFIPFLDAAQRFTIKVFSKVASSSKADDEEREEQTIDALLDFWYQTLRHVHAEIRYYGGTELRPKINYEGFQNYSRSIVENYIACHLHKPLGQLVQKSSEEVDVDQADDQDDSAIHALQLVSFGLVSRFDALHTAQLLIELLITRLRNYEALLAEYFTKQCYPGDIKEWEHINDDLHWLLLMLQHYLTQTGFGETGFMCNEILSVSSAYKADVQKTIEGFEKFDYSSPEVDPIVRLIILALNICQLEMQICKTDNTMWISVQTNNTLTTLLSRFCLTYLYPKESDYTVISENMNYCFGQDAPTAKKFLKFVIEHTCCIILCRKLDSQILKKNVQLLIQLLLFHHDVKDIIMEAEEGTMTKMLLAQLKPENLSGFSSKDSKSIIKLATILFSGDEDWNMLIDFFTQKWQFIMTSIQNQQHQSQAVSSKFLEFCDFAMGVCEACDDETSARLFEQLLVPIVESLPVVLQAFGSNFESVPIAVFELLYYIVKLPMVNIITWENVAAKSFYENCQAIIETYIKIASKITDRGNEEEDCEDIIAILTFNHEVMKRDWGNSWVSCDTIVKFSMEKLNSILKPEYLQFPRIRTMYYRLLVYLVDEDDRLSNLSDELLETIVSSILIALKSQFDKEVDNHIYTIIIITCRTIYLERGKPVSDRLAKFMLPVLPVVFESTLMQTTFTINTETAELIAPAFFSLRCCFTDMYKLLVKDLIEKQDDPLARSKIESLFENLETKIQRLTLNRAACREFSSLFVPFLAEIHNYIATR